MCFEYEDIVIELFVFFVIGFYFFGKIILLFLLYKSLV